MRSSVIRSMGAVGAATYKEWAAYRSHMAVSLLVGPVYYLVQYFIWQAVYEGRDTLNGLTLDEMLAYFGIAAVIHYLIFDFADWNLQMLVRTGKFVTFAMRPMPHWLFALSQKLGHRTLGFWIEFVPIGLLFLFVFQVDLIPAHPWLAAASIALSFMMNFLVNYCVGLTAFWLVRAEGIRRVILLLKDITAGVFVPLSFFPEAMQKVLFFLPFQFITYVPTRVMLGEYELAGITLSAGEAVLMQLGAVASAWIVMLLVYRLALKRFTGVGV
ncbi:ABC-2 type transport system permease protein [Paenibacillus phyllosphaerae]|uniref:ABC-2 type transport system permease protein n=1 Tax=Paenibacillus phyllosphaerae TaxID=274593 RepID=A0A7W5B1L5_9BACL|nr:ABC-2 family transporter protein [Paenibacillus phyllosphaerae]MBB3112732.1 ABC-2 type transport system permease protein [Paenibacillus phyllosphaerae]